MGKNTILILGGYGMTGRLIAHYLLERTGVHLILAGRSKEKAAALCAEFNKSFSGNRVTAAYADAADTESLKTVFKDADLVVVASSTSRFTREIAETALEMKTDYFDIQHSTYKNNQLNLMADKIRQSGRCFITDGGFHPGLPAALIHHASPHFDQLTIARVGSVIKINWAKLEITESTLHEFLEEIIHFKPLMYMQGRWQKVAMFSKNIYIRMDFGEQFGMQYCYAMMLSEMNSLPELYPSLQDCGFFVGGFNWFVDYLILPFAALVLKAAPKSGMLLMSRLMYWGLKKFSKPPYGTLLKLEAEGIKNHTRKKMEIVLSHADGYVFTAIPVVASLMQYLDGSIKKTGLWTQAHVVEPNRLMRDLQAMGIGVNITERVMGNG